MKELAWDWALLFMGYSFHIIGGLIVLLVIGVIIASPRQTNREIDRFNTLAPFPNKRWKHLRDDSDGEDLPHENS